MLSLLLAAQVAAALPTSLDVVAMDYAFRAPPRVRAGQVTIRLRNTGTKLHHLQLFKLADGKRLGDLYPLFLKAKSVGEPPAWAMPAGGPSAAMPGATIAVTETLEPGRYALICWIPAGDGTLHFMKGMAGEVEVVGPATRAAEPKADVVATTRDYTITFDTPITAGRRTVRIENRGTHAHEWLVVKLKPGMTARDVAEWSGAGQMGPAPHSEWFGMAAIAPGTHGFVTHAFTPGEYVAFCLAEGKDGVLHLMKGMETRFRVR